MTSLAEGKTKRILKGPEPHTVVLQAVNRLTGGDAARVAEINEIGAFKTEQAANCFQLLAAAGIPTAFVSRQADHELLCRDCDMLPIEFVVRRYAFGSYLKRAPEFRRDGAPHRFDDIVLEQFHKLCGQRASGIRDGDHARERRPRRLPSRWRVGRGRLNRPLHRSR